MRYTGSVASRYDEKRQRSSRWWNEVKVFGGWLQETPPSTILDCPFGTGRWIPQYDEIGAKVIGVDISGDMLAEARKKMERPDAYELIEGSIFDTDCSQMAVDLIACIRLLNWMPYDQVVRTITGLSACPANQMVVGCSVVPAGTSPLKRFLMKGLLRLKNMRTRSGSQFVHDEKGLLEAVESQGWKLDEKQFIFRNSTRENLFYRFSR